MSPNFSSVNTILLSRSLVSVSRTEVIVSIDGVLTIVHHGGYVGTCSVSLMYECVVLHD